MIDEHKMILHLNDWWYSSFGYEETEESKAIKKVIDEVEKYVEHTADRKTEPTISKMEQVDKDINVRSKTEPSNSENPNNCEPKICDTCRYYNSNIPCGSTPSACKEADKFAKEFVDGLKKLKPKVEPTTQTETQNSNLTFEKADEPQTEVTTDCRQTDCPWE